MVMFKSHDIRSLLTAFNQVQIKTPTLLLETPNNTLIDQVIERWTSCSAAMLVTTRPARRFLSYSASFYLTSV